MPDVRVLAGVSGRSVDEVLRQLKDNGATAVAVAEETFDDLLTTGQIIPVEGKPFVHKVQDAGLAVRLRAFSRRRLFEGSSQATVLLLPGGEQIILGSTLGDLRSFGTGFNAHDAQSIRSSGLSLVARLNNQPLGSRSAIDAMLDSASSVGAEGIIFGGDQVLGRRDSILYTAEQIRKRNLWIGPVEFTSQGGLPRIMKELQDRMIRIHSMVAAEIDRNEPPDIVDRYVRAVVERNIKGLFLRPISLSSLNPLESFSTYLSTIKNGLQREGYEAKKARPGYPEPRPPWAAVICGLGIAATGAFLSHKLLGRSWGIGMGGLLFLLAIAAYFGVGLKFLTLAGALVFPTLAMLAAFDEGNSEGNSSKWIFGFFWITAISILGGLHVAALLTLPSYMLRLDQFYGVKVAHFLPPLFVAIYLMISGRSVAQLLQSSVRWVDMVVIALVLAAVFVMLSRTGNDAPGDVSSLELKIRNVLDRLLPERPRTKEFLIGHPSLVVALYLAFKGRRAWLPLAAFLASIGQVSVLNTFCHLHTPIAVSAMRVIIGVAVGGVIGLLTLAFFRKLFVRRASA
jgi:hypothetical protein